tara:strand:- start:775 stop:1401 length:627 start_codon:yes stop_codon:yes gene_type:complete
MRVIKNISVGLVAVILATGVLEAQDRRASPRGHTASQIGGSYDSEGSYEGGHWIDVYYGRPVLRGRHGIFGSGAEYGQGLLRGAPIWRMGADQSTRFITEADLLIGGQRLAAGEYTMFAELVSSSSWTLIFSTWGAKENPREENPNALWGAYGYTDEKDVMRTTMTVRALQGMSTDNMSIVFQDINGSYSMNVYWDDQHASVPIEVAN